MKDVISKVVTGVIGTVLLLTAGFALVVVVAGIL